MSAFQGASPTVTALKQRAFCGIVDTRITMSKHPLKLNERGIRIRDAMCGSGENTVDGAPLDGSPISILSGVQRAIERCKIGVRQTYGRCKPCRHVDNVQVAFSDVRSDALESLNGVLRPHFMAHGIPCRIAAPRLMTASEALNADMAFLDLCPDGRLIAILDPNGPTDLPYAEVARLLNAYSRRADVIINISATAMKRVRGSAEAANRDYADVCGQFADVFFTADPKNGACWIRRPIPSDSWQWTILCYWAGRPPTGDWKNQRFVKFSSDEGRAAIEKYTKIRRCMA